MFLENLPLFLLCSEVPTMELYNNSRMKYRGITFGHSSSEQDFQTGDKLTLLG